MNGDVKGGAARRAAAATAPPLALLQDVDALQSSNHVGVGSRYAVCGGRWRMLLGWCWLGTKDRPTKQPTDEEAVGAFESSRVK
eukprot:364888-Chlamydomonas_euryale.AAC.5